MNHQYERTSDKSSLCRWCAEGPHSLVHRLKQEIVEEGVTSIELAASSTFNRSYTPDAGRVKWFRDELGQLWCKFTTASKSNGHVIPGTVRDHVWSADRVVQVQYDKERS